MDMVTATTAERIIRASRGTTLVAHGVPRGNYQHILIAVDMSECSGDALDTLTALGLRGGAKASVLHVFNTSITRGRTGVYMSLPSAVQYRASAEAEAKRELSSFLARRQFEADEIILRPNDLPEHFIIDVTAREVSADLVVMGTHGRSGFMRFALGSVTRDLLGISEVDMLVIAPKASAHAAGPAS